MTLNELTESHRQHYRDVRTEEIKKFPVYGEVKEDGEYTNVFIHNGIVRIANKYPHESIYVPTVHIMDDLPKTSCVLEGEFISTRGDLYHFLSDRTKPNCPTLALRIFGIIYLGNQNYRNLTYEQRWNLLRQLIPNDTEHVALVKHKLIHNQEGLRQFYNEVRSEGKEGLVLKTLGSHYENGWKVKEHVSIDVIVTGIEKTKCWKNYGFPNSFLIALNDNGRIIPFGKTSNGLSVNEKKDLAKIILRNKIGEDNKFIFCKPSEVLEIVCQEVRSNHFRSPRIRRWRTDKTVYQTTPFNEINTP